MADKDYPKVLRETADYLDRVELDNIHLSSVIRYALEPHGCICEYGKGNPNAKGHDLRCQLLRSAIGLTDTEAA